MKVLANDGIDQLGRSMLEERGFQISDLHLAAEELLIRISEFDVLTVRSATKVDRAVIDAGTRLKLIGRGGVGLDNIDTKYAASKGVDVINTPAASSDSVAEMVFAHLLCGARFLHQSNRKMPTEGSANFNTLKKKYSAGRELKGSSLGIIGFGRIGKEVARRAAAFGMHVFAYSLDVDLSLPSSAPVVDHVTFVTMEALLSQCDYITLHIPAADGAPLIGAAQFEKFKKGAAIINTSRGGLIDEEALLSALDSDRLSFAALDVFEGEPQPLDRVLQHPKISLSPHIGGSTVESQARIGLELADLIIQKLG